MKRITIGRRGTVVAAITVAALTLVGGVAYATIPGPDGTINGCYRASEDDQKGQLRVVNDPTACRSNEVPIAWNRVGPQGAKGEQGEPGARGTNGTDGVSVITASEPAGADCADGGVQLTAADGVGYVCNGNAGADGKDGTNGADGADGQDGVSVTSAAEPAGANCANGGSRFTAANGTTYACNGESGTVAAEPWHNVGGPDEPSFENGWGSSRTGFSHQAVASFFKDPFGVVHLKGTVQGGAQGIVFTLPAGYRPALEEYFFNACSGCVGSPVLTVRANGSVVSGTHGWASLSGVTFRAG